MQDDDYNTLSTTAQDFDNASTTSSASDCLSVSATSAVPASTSSSGATSDIDCPDDLSDSGGTVQTQRKPPGLGGLRIPATRMTPRIVSLPPGADRATLLGILHTHDEAQRAFSMPAGPIFPRSPERARQRTTTSASSVYDDEDSVVIMVNRSTETTSVTFLESNAGKTAEVLPPRPILALHGPSSLPYARCPSGAEGTVIQEPGNAAGVIWGLDHERRSYIPSAPRPIPVVKPTPALVNQPVPTYPQAQPLKSLPNRQSNVIYQSDRPQVPNPQIRGFDTPAFVQQPPRLALTTALYNRPPISLPSPNLTPFPFAHNTIRAPTVQATALNVPMSHASFLVPPPPSAVPPTDSARSKVRSFDHAPLDLEEIRRELIIEQLKSGSIAVTPINIPPPANLALGSARQNVHPVIGQRYESLQNNLVRSVPSSSASFGSSSSHMYNSTPSMINPSPAFSTSSFDTQDSPLIATPQVLSSPVFHPYPDLNLPEDPVIAKVGISSSKFSGNTLQAPAIASPTRDFRQLRVVSDPYMHASLHASAVGLAKSRESLMPGYKSALDRLRTASCDDQVISLADLRRGQPSLSGASSDSISIPASPAIRTSPTQLKSASGARASSQPAVLGAIKTGLGPYRAPRSIPLAKLMQKRMSSLPALIEEATPPATPTTPHGIGLGFDMSANLADQSPIMQRRAVSQPEPLIPRSDLSVDRAVVAAPPKFLQSRGPSSDGAKGFAARRKVSTPPKALPPSPLGPTHSAADADAGTGLTLPPLPSLVALVQDSNPQPSSEKKAKSVKIADDAVVETPTRRGPTKLKKVTDRKATPGPAKRKVSAESRTREADKAAGKDGVKRAGDKGNKVTTRSSTRVSRKPVKPVVGKAIAVV